MNAEEEADYMKIDTDAEQEIAAKYKVCTTLVWHLTQQTGYLSAVPCSLPSSGELILITCNPFAPYRTTLQFTKDRLKG